MYNRYIPQPDGSYRRNRIQEDQDCAPTQHYKPEGDSLPDPCCEQATNCQTCPNERMKPDHSHRPRPQRPMHHRQEKYTKPCAYESRQDTQGSVGSFLRGLLPKNFDTGDLLIVLLLLLMAGDCKEDQNSALLTLALYFFM